MPRESAFTRLIHHFHEHPQGRFHEILFWSGLGVLLGAIAYLAWRFERLSDPLALILAIIAVCFVGWAFLPQRKSRAPPPLPPGKRGEIAKQVQQSKAEKKRKKGPPGQHPPIRRG